MNNTNINSLQETYIKPIVQTMAIYGKSWLPLYLHKIVEHELSHLPPSLNLSLAPILALADFTLISLRTIQTGTSSLLDILVLCPGLHKQSSATNLSEGEYPATAAMTTGYVFRTENQAMVHFLQRVGVTGNLVTLSVKESPKTRLPFGKLLSGPAGLDLMHGLAVLWTLEVMATCWKIGDELAVAYISMLIFSRLLNVLAIRRRLAPERHGAREPGIKGDLLVLVSQDKWVRIQGLVDDLKAVTSGQWLRDQSFFEQCMVDAGICLVYGAVVVGSNASQKGALMIAALLLGSSVLLGMSNLSGGRKLSEFCRGGRRFWMHGRVVEVVGAPKMYDRRRVLADELIKETGRDDWAVQMGMIPGKEAGPAIM